MEPLKTPTLTVQVLDPKLGKKVSLQAKTDFFMKCSIFSLFFFLKNASEWILRVM